ncbi:MAG: DNA-binding protein WhiA [Clostridia bacterium]|nr:DNA-binding protein WhiA [Clostridia bacterium]
MSFSSDIKDELIKLEQMPDCCLHSMAYGMFLFGRSFNLNDISLMTDNEKVAMKYADMGKKACNIEATLNVSEAGKYTVSFEGDETRKKVLSVFSCTGNERNHRIDRGNLANDSADNEEISNCCDAAFLRGVFLSCGTASDPNKSYHLEFVVPYKTLSLDLMKILNDYGIKAKHMTRRYVNVIYIKDSESIEDILALMGAHISAMEVMNIKIYKDVRNMTNRRINFENANLSRTIFASFDQVKAIKKLKSNGSFAALPSDLKQVAMLRMDNPDISLREIGEMCEPKMSRSAVNHRLKKLISISQQCEKKKEEKVDE